MPKEIIVATVSKFGKIKSIKIQLIGLWQKAVVEFTELEQAVSLAAKWSFLISKDLVCVAIVVGDCETWTSRDWFKALLFTLPVETTAHDLGDLLEGAGRKTCVINWSLETGNRVCCAVVCFDSDEVLESAFCTELILGGVKLSWTRLDLIRCKRCKKFGHSALECDAELAKLYAKKNVLIFRPAVFGGKSWAQVVSVALVSHGFCAGSGSSSPSSGDLSLGEILSPLPVVNSPLSVRLVLLKCSVELLSEQISNILSHLNNISSAPLAPSSQLAPSVVVFQSPTSVFLVVANSDLDFDMMVDDLFVQPTSFSPGVTSSLLGPSSSKVLTSKVGGLESKLVALDISIGLILAKLDQLCAGSSSSEDIFRWHKESSSSISIVTETKLCFGLQPWIMKRFEGVWVFMSGLNVGFCGAGVAIFVNDSLVRHVSKVKEVKGRVLSIHLLFKNKLSVSVIGLYACASGGDHFAQASVINSFITDTVNKSSFVVLGGDFNEDNLVKGVSLRKCLGLDLVNVFGGHSLARIPTWNNSRGISKVLDYILVNDSLISVVVDRDVGFVSEFFDTDHLAVLMSIGLGGLLDAHLNSICKHANKDHWKFKIKNVNEKKWAHFKDLSECVLLGSLNRFKMAEDDGNLDGMWGMLADAMTASAEKFFSRHWYSEFNCAKNRLSSKFSRLELLVVKLLKVLKWDDTLGFVHLADTWFKVDSSEASKVFGMIGDGMGFAGLINHLSKVRKQYRKSKYCESEVAKRFPIKDAIDKYMKKFKMDKGGMIRSILEQPFRKVVLDYLVVGDFLILEPDKVKLKVNDIMVNWTRKQNALPALAFSLVMCDITMCEMSSVISDLPDGKAAGLSDITNELWKHAGCLVLECLLSLLNSCLHFNDVPMARKILSKVLSNRISLACSRFDVLHGNNFSVFKDTSTQSPISAVSLIVEDALEKGRELWLVLQNMRKAYDSVGWPHLEASLRHIKMCNKFIKFFGNIHNSRFNRIITNFGLSNGYKVLDGLDQVARQDHLCGYQINLNFVSKTGKIETSGGMTSFFAAGVFVDDTIWVGNGQASMQHIFNMASKFFLINDININNEKTVAISINKRVGVSVLFINSQAIAVANSGVSHQYLGIFLSTDGLSKLSLTKANSDIKFFSNMVLRKAVSDKQFSYLVSAVLQPIVLCWAPLNPLQYPVKLRVNTSNNFLVGVVCIFLDNKLSLDNRLLCAFHFPGHFPMSLVLGDLLYFNVIHSLKIAGVAYGDQLLDKNSSIVSWHTFRRWKKLGSRGPMPLWFLKASAYLSNCLHASPPTSLASVCASVLNLMSFVNICEEIHGLWADEIDVACGAAVYFPGLNKGLGVEVHGVLSLTLAELQAVVLALECISASVSVALYMDSQVAIDACVAELGLLQPDCRNSCWIKRRHVVNLIESKDLTVCWIKVKGHAGIAGNVLADVFTEQAAHSGVSLPARINCRYVVADGRPVSSNAHHFVRDIFHSICKFQWEVSPGQGVVSCLFGLVVDWNGTALVWHPDSHMLSGSTCQATAAFRTYFMKAVHFKLPVAVRKRLYNRDYPGVSCLFCGNMELPDHGFTCVKDVSVQSDILGDFGSL
ncbi:hypothetical protein G9A89_022449 [Geosiphon pyriformis]|nr:hypothetical protein G9A89_022449 [Geosiphon pyriformis]